MSNTTDSDQGDFHCPVEGCGKRFKRKEHLVRHGASHSDIRPFVCGICEKSFARSDVLNRHVRQHGADSKGPTTGSILNACDACHARKAKCSGGNPCNFCSEHGVQCRRDRTVARHRATKEAQKGLMDSLTSKPAPAASHPQYADDDTMMMDADASIMPTETIPASAFQDLPFSLPEGISEAMPGDTLNVADLLGMCVRTLRIHVRYSPYESPIEELMLDSYLVAYFLHLYQRWPMIHLRTFDKRQADPLLVWTMIMAGARCRVEQRGSKELADHLQGDIFTALSEWFEGQKSAIHDDEAQALPKLQAATIFVVYLLYFGDSLVLETASQVNAWIISTLGGLGAFAPQVWTKEIPWADPGHSTWIQTETRKRLTSMTFLSHVYLSILLKRAPTMDYRELNCRLPSRNSWWWAMSSKEIHDLRTADPNDRSPKPMSMFISDTLAEDKINADVDIRQLEVVDCHLIQCAMFAMVWNEKRQVELVNIDDELVQPNTFGVAKFDENRRAYWTANLDFWKSRVEREYWKRQPANVRKEDLLPRTLLETVNLVLYNISMITLNCNLPAILEYAKLVSQQYDYSSISAETSLSLFGKISAWATTPEARLAVYLAGQIFRPFVGKDFSLYIGNVTVEPIPKAAIFNAALVIWAFNLNRRCCPNCRAGLPAEWQSNHNKKLTMEITFPYDPDFVRRWMPGEGRMFLNGILICRCNMNDILSRFEAVLNILSELDDFSKSRASFMSSLMAQTSQPTEQSSWPYAG